MKSLQDLVADKIENDSTLLRIPLDNIDRWIANGHTAPHRLEQWRQIIHRAQQSPEGLQELLTLLRDRSAATERLRDFAPFAGVLTAAERAVIIRQCAYSH
ncbi:MAG: hypothetical protein L0Z50_11345 [Verrucomicrobiales bacterium]|nr:hypothetical protein [Verrucomicrobiales bacterium]